jgi:hypothetical protein
MATKRIYAGDDVEFSGSIVDEDLAAIDITGFTLNTRLVREGEASSSIEKTASIVDGPEGTYSLTYTDEETDDLEEGATYLLQVQSVDGGGLKNIVKEARIEILPSHWVE